MKNSVSQPAVRRLDQSFYLEDTVTRVARRLLGKHLVTHLNGQTTGGMIVETEAYGGVRDRASHAFGGKGTARTEIMYWQGGYAYVYLIYGLHALFNVITNRTGIPDAVLIRAIIPSDGIEVMLLRRKQKRLVKSTADGPGKVCQALGIRTEHSGQSLINGSVWIEDRGVNVKKENIRMAERIGIDYAGEDARRPWRFCLV